MRNKIAAIKTHVDQNRHNIRDLAIAASVIAVSTGLILKVRSSDSDATDAS